MAGKVKQITKRVAKGAAITVAAVVAVAILAVLALTAPPLQDLVFTRLLNRASASLPGELAAEDLSWRFPAVIEGRGLLWADKGDTLASAERLRVSASILPLLWRDIKVHELGLSGLNADIPAIGARFPADTASAGEQAESEPVKRFPREGSLKGVPSLAVDRLQLEAEHLRLTEGLVIYGLELSGGVDLRHERQPRAALEGLALNARRVPDSEGTGDGRETERRQTGGGARLDTAAFEVDLATGSVMGAAGGYLSADLPFVLTIVPEGQDTFRLLLVRRSGESPPESPGLSLRCKLARFEGYVGGLKCEAVARTPGVEELAEIDLTASRFEGLPPLEGLTLLMQGGLEFHSGFAAEVQMDVEKNSWIEGGNLHLAYRDGNTSIEDLSLELPDLQANVQAWLRPDSLTLQAALHSTGTRWLEALRPGARGLDDLSAGFFAQVDGPRSGPKVKAGLELSARKGNFVLDRLSLSADSPGTAGAPVELELRAEAAGLRLSGSASVSPPSGESSELVAELSPFVLQDTSEAGRRPSSARDCLFLYGPEAGEARLEGFRLTGAHGDVFLDAAAYKEDSGATRVRSAGSISLNTARILSGVAPEDALIDDLGPVRGDYKFRGVSGGSGFDFDASLDLGETEWIDRGLARVRRSGGRIDIDSLAVEVEGLDLKAAGSVENEVWDMGARLSVADARLLRRLYPSATAGVELSLSGSADLSGTLESPHVRASLDGKMVKPGLRVPSLSAEVLWDDRGLDASLAAGEGVDAGPLRFDSVGVEYSAGEKVFPADVVIEADGRELDFYCAGELNRSAESEWRIGAKSLSVSLREQNLSATGPFVVTILPAEKRVQVDRLDMKGSMGALSADGFTCPAACELKVNALLTLPDEPEYLSVPEGLWPETVEINLFAAGARDIEAALRAGGLSMGDRTDLVVALEASSVPDGVKSRVTITHVEDVLLEADAELPASVSLYPPAASLADGPVRVEMQTRRFPLPLQAADGPLVSRPERTAELDSRLFVCGDASRPVAFAILSVRFPSWPKMKDRYFNLSCTLDSGEGVTKDDSPCEIPFALSDKIPDTPTPGLAAYFELLSPSGPEAGGTLVYPLEWSLSPPDIRALEDGELQLLASSDGLELSDFDNLLPPNYGLKGTATFRVEAKGPVIDPALEGKLEAKRVEVSMADGSNASASGDVILSGARKSPALDGTVEIHKGVILIPDRPRELHPAEGTAVLWELEGGDSPDAIQDGRAEESADSTWAERDPSGADAGEQVTEASGAQSVSDSLRTPLDLDVGIVIPAGLWIRGRGLEVEMAGDLRLIQKGGAPTVAGNLKAVRGRLSFLGRQFAVERGGAVFYGGDEINPSLDLVLATNVEGTIIRVLFGGTAKEPDLQLVSEPELPDGDIMSLLVFGRTADELDNDQVDLLGRRATDIAAAFGTSKLEMQLAQQLGVDMVRIGRESGGGDGSSLVIGKYISPKVLLKYEQVLEERTRFFVNLEYFLTRHFKVETLIGHQSQSAVELNWTSDY
jgi:hypothetical protein